MKTPTDIETMADERQQDPFFHDPSAPRFIFFDDERPSKAERQARNEAIDQEELASLNRPYRRPVKTKVNDVEWQMVPPSNPNGVPQRRLVNVVKDDIEWRGEDYIDPELERHQQRMEARRYEIWLAGWYRRNEPDNREKLLANLVGLELNEGSFLTAIRQGLSGLLSPIEVENVWQKLSVYKAVRDMLEKPVVESTQTDAVEARTRITFREVKVTDDYGNEVKVLATFPVTDIVRTTTLATASDDLDNWRTMHQALNGHGNVRQIQRPARRTLFLNPDGSRFLNDTRKTGSPIQAKMAFARRHGIDPDRVMVEKVNYEAGSPALAKLGIRGKASIYVVSARKLSNETMSSYFDPDPSWIEKVDSEGNWVRTYQFASGTLYRYDKSCPMVPNGSHILTIREFEQALLSNANLSDTEEDIEAAEFESILNLEDERFRGPDMPIRPVEKLAEDEQALYEALVEAEEFGLAEMMLVDTQNVAKEVDGESILTTISSLLFNTLDPRVPGALDTIEEAIFVKRLQAMRNAKDPYLAAARSTANTMSAICRLLFSLNAEDRTDAEAPASPSPENG